VRPDTGKIVWVGGPTIGSMHDLALLRNSGVLDLLQMHELVLADKGYQAQGMPQILTPIKKPRGFLLTRTLEFREASKKHKTKRKNLKILDLFYFLTGLVLISILTILQITKNTMW
jgi:hypothetical protein